MEKHMVGKQTGIALEDVTPLLAPWEPDAFGMMRPPATDAAMRLSLEMAACTYQMAIEPWLDAGWVDPTLQVDTELMTDFMPEHQGPALKKLTTSWKLNRLRAKLKQSNPLGQMAGALRQIRTSDTGKAAVLCHPAPDGRYVVAVSFMGTGGRVYDWFSNFRMTSDGGTHKGFLQLARQFEDNEEKIVFPETAAALGLPRLTLRDIITEAARPDSRFVLWVTGHSQGGALTQVWVRHKIEENHVDPRNIVGWGFASPSVMEGRAMAEPAAYPVWHVLNSDDVVPRMGAQVHLGACLIYPADEGLRKNCYGWPRDEASVGRRMKIRPILANMTDTPKCIEAAVAYLTVLSEGPIEEMMSGLNVLGMKGSLMQGVMKAADSRAGDLLRYIVRHTKAAYASITGHAFAEETIEPLKAELRTLIDEMGAKEFAGSLIELMSWPHAANAHTEQVDGSYPYIARQGIGRLTPMIWRGGDEPVKVFVGDAAQQDTITETAEATELQPREVTARRRLAATARGNVGRRYTERRAAVDTRHHAPIRVE